MCRKKLFILLAAVLLVFVVIGGVFFVYPSYVIKSMDSLIDNYNEEKITYDVASKKLKEYSESGNTEIAAQAKKLTYDLEYINNSHEAYYRGLKQLEKKYYKMVFEDLSDVKEQDYYYSNAQKIMQENLQNYRNEVFSLVEKLEADEKYGTAIDELKMYEKYSDDIEATEKITELKQKKEVYDHEQEKKISEKYKNEQLFTVINAYAYNDGYAYVFMKGIVVVQNLSEKVAKNIRLTILQFDNNGYPVEVEYSLFGKDNALEVVMKSANVIPGHSYGANYYWNLPDNASKIKACVKEVEYIDGLKWENPYHDYWLEAEKDRY